MRRRRSPARAAPALIGRRLAAPILFAPILAALTLAGPAPARADSAAGPGQAEIERAEAGLSPECRVPAAQLFTAAGLGAVKTVLAEHRPLKILAVGGSAAPGASSSYPAKLEAALEQALPKVDVVIDHRGLPGEISSGGGERLRTMVAEAEPDLVVWQVGTHDAIARVDPDVFADALGEAVAWVRSHGIDVVLVDPLYSASMAADADYNRIVATVRKVARQQGVPLVQRYEALRYLAGRTDRGESHLLGRQFRLNDLGLRCMAEHVALTVAICLARTDTGPAAPGRGPTAPAEEPGKAPGKGPKEADPAPALTAPQRAPG